MTAVTENAALRAIVVVGENANPDAQPTCRLLRDLGHDVVAAHSSAEASSLLEANPADLLVVDAPNDANRQAVLDRLSTMPVSQRPREVAVFSDRLDPALRQSHEARPRVHVFLRPLHVHGLLSVLRSLDRRAEQVA